MLIGSGLLARAFAPISYRNERMCIYAAGVSNSGCKDQHEFAREEVRLRDALHRNKGAELFVYFGTCSAIDPASRDTAYVQHKLAMESLVVSHPSYMILRLPQVAGKTPNPHTLLNFLYARISRSEAFTLWSKARRNIIDIDDIVFIARQLIDDCSQRNVTQNIANPVSYGMRDIVQAMERVVGKPAVFDVADKTSEYVIDISGINQILRNLQIGFGSDYLENILRKYYGPSFLTLAHEQCPELHFDSQKSLPELVSNNTLNWMK